MSKKEDVREKLINEIKHIAKENNLDTISQSFFKRKSNISENQISRNFDSWTEAVTLAGLKPDTSRVKKTDDELWEEFLRVCNKLNEIPGRSKFSRNTDFSSSIYIRRYRNWNNVLINFKKWLKIKHPSSKFINLLPDKEKIKKYIPIKTEIPKDFVWQSIKNTYFGPPMNFRGLIYEPINEQGVIFLFGKISEEIGFNIEGLRSGFPDCEGTRLIDKNKNQWEPVFIEFEYNSKSFLDHGHDPSKCDVIICWVHDWLECPIEVIDLKKIINKIKLKY